MAIANSLLFIVDCEDEGVLILPIPSLDRLKDSMTRKFEWVMENCKPYKDETGEVMEDTFEFEARCSNEYLSTLAIWRDIRKSIKLDINLAMDLITSARDEEKWNALVHTLANAVSNTIQFTFCRGFYRVKTRFAIVIFGIYAIEVEHMKMDI